MICSSRASLSAGAYRCPSVNILFLLLGVFHCTPFLQVGPVWLQLGAASRPPSAALPSVGSPGAAPSLRLPLPLPTARARLPAAGPTGSRPRCATRSNAGKPPRRRFMARYAPLYFRGLRFWRLSRIPVPTKNGAPRAPRRPRGSIPFVRPCTVRAAFGRGLVSGS